MSDPHHILRSMGFQLAPICATCMHFAPTRGALGRCTNARYRGMVTAAEDLQVVVPALGQCKAHSLDPTAVEIAAGPDFAKRYAVMIQQPKPVPNDWLTKPFDPEQAAKL